MLKGMRLAILTPPPRVAVRRLGPAAHMLTPLVDNVLHPLKGVRPAVLSPFPSVAKGRSGMAPLRMLAPVTSTWPLAPTTSCTLLMAPLVLKQQPLLLDT